VLTDSSTATPVGPKIDLNKEKLSKAFLSSCGELVIVSQGGLVLLGCQKLVITFLFNWQQDKDWCVG